MSCSGRNQQGGPTPSESHQRPLKPSDTQVILIRFASKEKVSFSFRRPCSGVLAPHGSWTEVDLVQQDRFSRHLGSRRSSAVNEQAFLTRPCGIFGAICSCTWLEVGQERLDGWERQFSGSLQKLGSLRSAETHYFNSSSQGDKTNAEGVGAGGGCFLPWNRSVGMAIIQMPVLANNPK